MAKPEHELPKPDPPKPADPNFGVGKPPSTDRPEKPSHELPHPDHPDISHPIARDIVKDKVEAKVENPALVQLHVNINRVLSQYGGQESNIPLNHEYWGMVNEYRRLNTQPKPSA